MTLTIAGALLVSALVEVFRWNLYAAQLTAATLTAAAAFVVGIARLRRLVPHSDPKAAAASLPPPDVAADRLLPYAIYGLGYYCLLAVDRVMVWTTPVAGASQALWVHPSYERGMVWALATALVPLSVLELLSDRFWQRLDAGQKAHRVSDLRTLRRDVRLTLSRLWAVLAAFSVVSVGGVWAIGSLLARGARNPAVRAFFSGPEVGRVFWLGAAGYQLLAWGLFVGLLHCTLGRTVSVVRALWRGVALNAAVAYLASRSLPPGWAALGFATGAGLFAWQMARSGRALTRRIDSYYFAAY